MVLKYSLVLIVVILVEELVSKPVTNVIPSPSLTPNSKEKIELQFKEWNNKGACNKICRLWKLMWEKRKAEERQIKDE